MRNRLVFREPLSFLLSPILPSLLVLFHFPLFFLLFCFHLLYEYMCGHVLDVCPILQAIALIFIPNFCVYMRFYENFLHFFGKGDHEAPSPELVVAFLASRSLVVQYQIVFGVMLEGIDIGIGLQSEELGGGDHQPSVVSHVQEVELGSDLHAKEKGGAAEWFGPFGVHQQEIVLAYLGDDECMGSFDVGCVVSLVVTDELRTGLACHWQVILDIVQASVRVLLVSVKQIESLIGSLDPQCFFRPLLPNKILLEGQKCAFMRSMLPNLYENVPIMRCEVLLALRTLRILFHELYDLALLDACGFVDNPNKIHFNFDAFGVWLGPNKLGIFELQFRQSFDLLKQDSKKLWAFPLAIDPRRSFISQAVGAEELFLIGGKKGFAVQGGKSAGRTDVGVFWGELDAADGAEDGDFLLNNHSQRIIDYSWDNFVDNKRLSRGFIMLAGREVVNEGRIRGN